MEMKYKITVKSDFMEDTFFVKSDAKALSLLRKINKLHLTIAKSKVGKKPYRSHYPKYWSGKRKYLSDLKLYHESLRYKIKVTTTHL